MKQGKSGGSVGTTSQGKGKGSREGKTGQGGGGRTQGAARPLGTTAYGGKGSKGRAVSGVFGKGRRGSKSRIYGTMAQWKCPRVYLLTMPIPLPRLRSPYTFAPSPVPEVAVVDPVAANPEPKNDSLPDIQMRR